jgi:hypothetical protein
VMSGDIAMAWTHAVGPGHSPAGRNCTNMQEGSLHVHEATRPLVGRTNVGETGHTDHIPCVVATPKDP